jgi:CheY-like chemotaxis protein
MRYFGKMRSVLLVEDDPTIRCLVNDVLIEEGYTVVAVEDGARALEVLEELRPFVILLDLYMPRVNGWQFLRTMNQRNADIPIVICSAVSIKELPRGVVGALKKPFSLDALVATVRPFAKS